MSPKNLVIASPALLRLLTGSAFGGWVFKQQETYYKVNSPKASNEEGAPNVRVRLARHSPPKMLAEKDALEQLNDLTQTDDVYCESTVHYGFYLGLQRAMASANKQRLKPYFGSFELPLNERGLHVLRDNALLAEATLVYAYSLLREGVRARELTAELTKYLLLNGASTQGLQANVKPYKLSSKKVFPLAVIEEGSWVVFELRFCKANLGMAANKTIAYGEPNRGQVAAYRRLLEAMSGAKSHALARGLKRPHNLPKGFELTIQPLSHVAEKPRPESPLSVQPTTLKENVPYFITLTNRRKGSVPLSIGDVWLGSRNGLVGIPDPLGNDLLVF